MKTEPFKIIAAILAGPVLGLLFSLFHVVFAPPRQGFVPLLYLPVCMLGFPAWIVLVLRKKLLGWKMLAGFALAAVAPIVIFFAFPPLWMPSGMSSCKQVASTPPVVRYECVDSSSDDPNYHREFIVEGYEGFPLMRVVDEVWRE